MRRLSIDELKKIEMEILGEVDAFCRENGLAEYPERVALPYLVFVYIWTAESLCMKWILTKNGYALICPLN